MIPHTTIVLQMAAGGRLQRVIPSYNPPPDAVTEEGKIFVRTADDQRDSFVYREAFVVALPTIDPLR